MKRTGENSGRRTRIGTEHADYVNYREARTKKPTNFVPEDVGGARKSTQKRRRYISSEETTRERRREERKEGQSRWRGRKTRTRETSLSACHRDRFNEKNVRNRPEIDSGGEEVAYIPDSSSLSSSVSSSRWSSLRRPRSRSLSSPSSYSFFTTSAAPYSLFALHHRRRSTVFRYRYRVLLRELTFSEFRSIKPRGRSSGDLSKAREKPDVLSQGKDPSSRAFPDFSIISTLSRSLFYSS